LRVFVTWGAEDDIRKRYKKHDTGEYCKIKNYLNVIFVAHIPSRNKLKGLVRMKYEYDAWGGGGEEKRKKTPFPGFLLLNPKAGRG